MQFGILGSGSWATAIAKILTDKGNRINWWIRNENLISQLAQRRHNPHYLSGAHFSTDLLQLSSNLNYIIESSKILIIAIPSSYVNQCLSPLNKDAFKNKKLFQQLKVFCPKRTSY